MGTAVDDYAPSPGRAAYDLFLHIFEKGFQMGSVIGTGLVCPAIAVSEYRKVGHVNARLLAPRLLAALAYSAAIGTVVAGGLGVGMVYTKPIDAEGMQDRAYRLHYNAGQNRVDQFSRVGAVLGAAAAAASRSRSVKHMLGAAAAGTAASILAHVSTMHKTE